MIEIVLEVFNCQSFFASPLQSFECNTHVQKANSEVCGGVLLSRAKFVE